MEWYSYSIFICLGSLGCSVYSIEEAEAEAEAGRD
jgi:hypothetical protein